jgi:hypothetical protein
LSRVPSDWIVLESQVLGCSAELWVNGVAIDHIGVPGATSATVPINQFVTNGENELAIVVNPGPTPSQASAPKAKRLRAPGATASATLTLYRQQSVTGDGSGEELGRVDWTARLDGEPEVFPQRRAAPVTIDRDLGPWAWQSADLLKLDDATVDQVQRLIEAVRAGLASGDATPFLDLATVSLDELARAYDDPPEDGPATIRAVVEASRGAPDWKFPEQPRETWDLRLVAGGRLVECLAQDWEPIVRSTPDEESSSFLLPMRVGRIDGRWVVLR